MDAIALANLIKTKKISAPELLACAIREIDRLNGPLNAVVMRDDEQALGQAQSLNSASPLAGVPFLAKEYSLSVGAKRV